MTSIWKSGDLSNTGNFKGIALSAIAPEITNKMLVNRIHPKIFSKHWPNQNGFQPDHYNTHSSTKAVDSCPTQQS